MGFICSSLLSFFKGLVAYYSFSVGLSSLYSALSNYLLYWQHNVLFHDVYKVIVSNAAYLL